MSTLPTSMETFSGILFDVGDPSPADVRLVDVAHHLSNVCRFGGAADQFYSVAAHSCLVHDLVALEHRGNRQLRLAALFHDAHEGYGLGDIPSPVKPLFGAPLRRVAHSIDEAVASAFGIHVDLFHHPAVKAADARAMIIEAARVKSGPNWAWTKDDPDSALPHGPDHPSYFVRAFDAEVAFLGRAMALDLCAHRESHNPRQRDRGVCVCCGRVVFPVA